jgi:hypothetical protein
MKSSDDVQIQSVAAHTNRGQCVLRSTLKPSPVDTLSCGVLAANRSSNYRPTPAKESVSGQSTGS